MILPESLMAAQAKKPVRRRLPGSCLAGSHNPDARWV